MRAREIPPDFRGLDYERDPAARVRYQRWLNGLWADKDALLATLLGDSAEAAVAPWAAGAAAGPAP